MKRVLKGVCLICLCVLLTGCFGNKKTDKKEKTKENKIVIDKKDVVKEQEIDGIKISNVNLNVIDGLSTYTATVTNTTDKNISIEDIDIIIKDKEEKELVSMLGYIGGTIKPNDKKEIISTTDLDLNDANSIIYKINKK